MAKRSLSMLLAIVTLFSLAVPAFAEEAPAEEPIVTEEPVVEATEEPAEEPEEVPEAEAPADEPMPVEAAEESVEVPEITEAPEPAEEPEEPAAEPMPAADEIASGFLEFKGDRETGCYKWSLSSDGVLTTSFVKSEDLPGSMIIGEWYEYREQIRQAVLIDGTPMDGGWVSFSGCTNLTSVTLPGGMTTLTNGMFQNCTSLTSVTIPDSVTGIGEDAFYGCTSLTSVTIPGSVTSIGAGVFMNCTSLTSVTLPAGLTTIGGQAFYGCTSLASVAIPAGMTSIALGTFAGCTSLTSVTIPSSVTTIEGSAFYGCSSLTSVTLPDSVTSVQGGIFSDCTSLANVTLSNSLTSIGASMFNGCKALTGVTIPAGVTSIGTKAFYGCTGLAGITIPAGVTSIGENAFASCGRLADVTILNPACDIFWNSTTLGESVVAVIRGDVGSTAEAYAKQFGYRFADRNTAPGPSVTPVPQLAAPTVKISKVSAGIKVTWNKITGAPRYMVYYKENGSGWKKIGTTTATTYTRAAKYLKNGATYQFTVRCCANDKTTMLSGYTASDSLKYTVAATGTSTTQLTAPTVKISKVSTGIKVTWNKVTGAPRYMVYYKENGGSWKKIGTTTATSYTRKAANLKNGVTYQFTVRCVQNDKKTMLSGYKASNSLKYTTAGTSATQLTAPTVKIAKVSGGIKVTWNKVTGAPRYMVYYKENGGSWKRIGTTTATSYTRKASALKDGVTYQFTVRCVQNDKKTMLSTYKASNSLKYTK